MSSPPIARGVEAARALRTSLMERMMVDVAADGATYHDVVVDTRDGLIRTGELLALGPDPFVAYYEKLAGEPFAEFEFTVEHLPDADGWTLATIPDLPPEGYAFFWEPVGINSAVATFATDGDESVGQLTLFRMGDSTPFSAQDLKDFRPLLDEALETLRAAARIAPSFDRDHELVFLADGSLWLHSTETASEAEHLLRPIRRRIRELEATGGSEGRLFQGRDRVMLTRIVREDGSPAWLASVTAMRGMPVHPIARLGKIQRVVASMAAKGASINQIARALGRSPHTVRTHLKDVYAALGIRSRVELTRIIDSLYARARDR